MKPMPIISILLLLLFFIPIGMAQETASTRAETPEGKETEADQKDAEARKSDAEADRKDAEAAKLEAKVGFFSAEEKKEYALMQSVSEAEMEEWPEEKWLKYDKFMDREIAEATRKTAELDRIIAEQNQIQKIQYRTMKNLREIGKLLDNAK